MAAAYITAIPFIKSIEGGYCSGGLACGGANSGETYKGIDRKFQPNWPGWKMIDMYKKQYGPPRWNSYFTGPLAPLIENEVVKFYTKFWNDNGLQYLQNQALANLLYAFIVHRDNAAQTTINAVAKKFGAKILSTTAITPNVAQVLERDISAGYAAIRAGIINHYRNIKNGEKFIKTRVNIFPTSISPATALKATATAAGLGVLGWFAALFGFTKF